ncbi:MAG: LacI family transcriptional regulator [Petrotoga sp.]|nr:LacI family transcriptional regulator [Petrotoga sp.]
MILKEMGKIFMKTMKEIAKMAGVSQSTVSRVINNNPNVNPEIKRKVLEYIRKYNYQPNRMARSLVKNKSFLIGIVLPELTNPYFPEILESLEEEANYYHYNIVLSITYGSLQREKEQIEMLLSRRVDGLIINPTDLSHVEHITKIKSILPTVICAQDLDGFDYVTVDHYLAGKIVAKYLINKGHINIGYIGYLKDKKLKGFYEEIIANNLNFNEDNYLVAPEEISDFTKSSEKKLLTKIIDNNITAVYTINDIIATKVINILIKNKMKVPDDVAVVGFDNTIICNLTNPPLTSVAQPTREIGRKSVDILIKKIEKTNAHTEYNLDQIFLPPRLVIRKST